MKKILFGIWLLAATTVSATEKSVSLERDFGTLYGTLLTPDAGDVTAETVALIIAGSGPTDRNGNSPMMGINPNSYRFLAEGLAQNGIASLRYDKRAIEQSAYADPSKIADVTLEDFIGDAAAWADYLKAQGFKRVVLIGHSEGALIALVAAEQTKSVDAVVSLSGAGYPLDEILRMQLTAQLVPARMDLMMQANGVIAKLKRGERVESYPQELAPLFSESVQPFLISYFKYDPRTEIRKLDIPVLIVSGDNDLQVTPDNAQALHKAQPKASLAILAGMNHTLKVTDGKTIAEQMNAYTDGTLAIDPAVVAAIAEFIGQL